MGRARVCCWRITIRGDVSTIIRKVENFYKWHGKGAAGGRDRPTLTYVEVSAGGGGALTLT